MKKSAVKDMFEYERSLLLRGIKRIAGVDEAGRGPLAGPVVAAAVILPEEWYLSGIPETLKGLNDSKQLSPKRREELFETLTSNPLIEWGVGIVDSSIIDTINILRATHKAMNDAVCKLSPPPEYVIVDGTRVESLQFIHTPIIKGDRLSFSIAAASIIAKVIRDRLMIELDKCYPEYGFATHKGYGTEQHLQAIQKFGPCPIHRRSFAPLKNQQQELF